LPQLDILFGDDRWRKIPKLRTRLQKATEVTLSQLPKNLIFPVAITLLLTKDKVVQGLNRDYRGKDKPTNVLSFPQFTHRELTKIGKGNATTELGDIVIAYQYMVAEAKNDHKILINHFIHLFIHGLLHLFGYDHISDKDANRMERLEKQIMAQLQLPDPYQIEDQTAAKRRPMKAKKLIQKRSR
jgi:probable rRNA maturation factor